MSLFSLRGRRRGRTVFLIAVEGRLMDEENEMRWAFALGALAHGDVSRLTIRRWRSDDSTRMRFRGQT